MDPSGYLLRTDGMTMTAADGRTYRLDRETMVAEPVAPVADTVALAARRIVLPPYF